LILEKAWERPCVTYSETKMYRLLIIKRSIEEIFILPFILIGNLIAFYKPSQREYRVYFLFPFFSTGGAEKVHAQIANAAGGADCIIFFTRRSQDSHYLEEFKKSGCVIKDISRFTDNKWLYFINLAWRGIISGYINRQKKTATVFNGQCNFAYKISPWVSKKTRQIELIHSFNSFAPIRVPFLRFYESQVMISQQTIKDFKSQYSRLHVPHYISEKIIYIPNGINIPDSVSVKNFNIPVYDVLFVGRGTPEKRVHIVARIAEKAIKESLPLRFILAGDVKNSIPAGLDSYCSLLGSINNEKQLQDIYNKSHFLILTSLYEGFPLAVMEAMSLGLIILSTPAGDIPFHVKENENGFLFEGRDDESITGNAIKILKNISVEPQHLAKMSAANISYAKNNFAIEKFNENYRKLLS